MCGRNVLIVPGTRSGVTRGDFRSTLSTSTSPSPPTLSGHSILTGGQSLGRTEMLESTTGRCLCAKTRRAATWASRYVLTRLVAAGVQAMSTGPARGLAPFLALGLVLKVGRIDPQPLQVERVGHHAYRCFAPLRAAISRITRSHITVPRGSEWWSGTGTGRTSVRSSEPSRTMRDASGYANTMASTSELSRPSGAHISTASWIRAQIFYACSVAKEAVEPQHFGAVGLARKNSVNPRIEFGPTCSGQPTWSDAAVDHAVLTGSIATTFGWPLHVGPNFNPRSLRNFPCQANGAEMLRLAACFATEQGIEVCALIHDAVLICAPLGRLDSEVEAMRACMAKASRIVLDGFELRTVVHPVRYPDHYSDPRGTVMWDRVMRLIAARKGAKQQGVA